MTILTKFIMKISLQLQIQCYMYFFNFILDMVWFDGGLKWGRQQKLWWQYGVKSEVAVGRVIESLQARHKLSAAGFVCSLYASRLVILELCME